MPLGWLLTTSVGKAVEKLEPLFIAGGNVKMFSCCGKQYDNSSKKEKIEHGITIWSSNSNSGYMP